MAMILAPVQRQVLIGRPSFRCTGTVLRWAITSTGAKPVLPRVQPDSVPLCHDRGPRRGLATQTTILCRLPLAKWPVVATTEAAASNYRLINRPDQRRFWSN
jgi:hypothetical protein